MMAGPIDPEFTEGQDPNAIDISLNLIGPGAERAIDNLTAALSRLEAFSKQFATTDPGQRQKAQTRYAETGLPPERRAPIEDHASRIPGVQYIDPKTGETLSEQPRPPFRARPIDKRGNPQLFDETTSRPPTNVSATDPDYQFKASEPPEPPSPPSSPRRWDRALQMASQVGQRLHQSPLHGALDMAGNVALLKAAGGGDLGGEGGGFMDSLMGSVAAQSMMGGHGPGRPGGPPPIPGGPPPPPAQNIFHTARAAAGVIGTGALLANRIGNFTNSLTRPGVELGYERGSQLQVGPFGMQIPSLGQDSALRQEVDRRVNAFRLRLTGGINGDQAQEIMSSIAGSGFSGQAGENVAFDSVAPLVRQGQDPRVASDMVTHAIRNGNASLADITSTLDDLGESARTARMTLTEYQQSLDDFAKTAEQSGGTYAKSVELGRQVTDATGITPQQAQPLLQSPIFQAMAFQHNGVLPNAVGDMSPDMFTSNIASTVKFAMRATRAFARPTIDPATGQPVPGSARANQMVQAAQFAGLPRETFQRLAREAQRLPALGGARAALSTFDQQNRQASRVLDPHLPPERRAGMFGPGDTQEQRDHRDRVESLQKTAEESMRTKNWEPVHKALIAAAPGHVGDTSDKKRVDYFRNIREIEAKDDPNDRLKEARKLLRRESQQAVSGSDRPTVTLDLTGPAKRLVRQIDEDKDAAKREARRGGAPVAGDRSKPDQQPRGTTGMW